MSSLNKIKKNADNFRVNEMYKNMTPQQIKDAIQIALDTQRKELIKEFNEKLTKLEEQHNNNLKYNTSGVIDTISVELLYELANQMNYWDLKDDVEEDVYIKESAKIRIYEIHTNTMKSIRNYLTMKTDEQARKTFEKKKKKIKKEFKIKF